MASLCFLGTGQVTRGANFNRSTAQRQSNRQQEHYPDPHAGIKFLHSNASNYIAEVRRYNWRRVGVWARVEALRNPGSGVFERFAL
jgi:hypothetical protein